MALPGSFADGLHLEALLCADGEFSDCGCDAGVAAFKPLTDHGATPVLRHVDDLLHWTYVDNVGVMGGSEEGVNAGLLGASGRLSDVGPPCHEVELASKEPRETLGTGIHGAHCRSRCSRQRYWTLR